MPEKTFFKIIIVVLLLINAGTIGYLWFANKPGDNSRPEGEDVVGFLTRELNLNPVQHDKLVTLHDGFVRDTRDVHEHLHQLHTPFFNELRNDKVDTIQVNNIVDSLSFYHRQMEWLTLKQFKDIRNICTPEQQQRFDSIVDETMSFIGPRPPGNKK